MRPDFMDALAAAIEQIKNSPFNPGIASMEIYGDEMIDLYNTLKSNKMKENLGKFAVDKITGFRAKISAFAQYAYGSPQYGLCHVNGQNQVHTTWLDCDRVEVEQVQANPEAQHTDAGTSHTEA